MRTMNKIKALAVLLVTSYCCHAQSPETFSGTFTEGLYELCKPGQVVVSPTPQDNLSVSGSANVVVKSSTGITLKPGFSVGGWNAGGKFSAKIDDACQNSNFVNNTISSNLNSIGLEDGAGVCGFSLDFLNGINETNHIVTSRGNFDPDAIVTCGRFDLLFEDVNLGNGEGFDAGSGIGADRRNTACAVFQYVESVLNITPGQNQIEIYFYPSYSNSSPPSNPNLLGVAGPYFPFNLTQPGFYGGNLYNHIISGVDPDPGTARYDAAIRFNFSNSLTHAWQNDYQDPWNNCRYDLFTVMLHEVTHALGWFSWLKEVNSIPMSGSTHPDQYSLYDREFLWWGNIHSPAPTFTKLVTYDGNNDDYIIFSQTNCIRDGNIWMYGTGQYNDQPITSSSLSFPFALDFTQGSSLSHFEGNYCSFAHRGFMSPGFTPEYVMTPYLDAGILRRKYSNQELRGLLDLGYTLNSSFPEDDIIINNTPPFTTKDFIVYNDLLYPDMGNGQPDFVDYTMNNNGLSHTFYLNTDPNLVDNENDNISIYPGSLYNIRGCGTNGNDHGQLTVNQNGDEITFTPRTDFIGRAQFGFHLWDGKEKGAFMVYTIDVLNGNSFNNGNEFIINGDFEQGTEVMLLNDNNIHGRNSQLHQLLEGRYEVGHHMADGCVLSNFNTGWGPISRGPAIRNSRRSCGQGFGPFDTYGWGSTTFPLIQGSWNMPDANGQGGNRYLSLKFPHVFLRLAQTLEQCHRYKLEFDINFDHWDDPVTTTSYGFTFRLTEGFDFPTTPFNQENQFSIPVNGGWQHVEYEFTYCPAEVSNFINLIAPGNVDVFVDNFSMVEVETPDLAVDAGIDQMICLASYQSVILSPDIPTGMCDLQINWTPITGLSDPTIASPTASPEVTTIYTITITDECNNNSSDEVAVFVYPGVTASIDSESDFICPENSELTLSAFPLQQTYLWSPGGETTQSIVIEEGGTYSVIITDENGCTASDEIEISEYPEISVSATSQDFVCGGDLGELSASVSGGVSPFSYSWSPSDDLNNPLIANPTVDFGLAGSSSEYAVTVTDDNGCIATDNIIVINHPCCQSNNANFTTYNGIRDNASDFNPTTINGIVGGNIEFAINGIFTIDEDFTLNSCDVLLGTDARIVVNAGAKLTITNGSHLRACDNMWRGIYVSSGGEIEVNEQALIEDAQIGIVLPGGAEYTIEQADFNKNYIHILLFRFNGSGSNPTGTIEKSRFLCQTTGSIATPNNNPIYVYDLLPPYSGHKTLMGIASLVLGNNLTIGEELHGNLFENATFGIYGYKSSIYSFGNIFKSILPDANCSNAYNQQGIFNCGSCIYDFDAANLLVSKDCEFYNSRYGVYSWQNKNLVSVNSSLFDGLTTGIYVRKAPVANKQIYIIQNEMTDVVTGILCYQNPGSDIIIGAPDPASNEINVEPVSMFGIDYGTGIQVLETQALTATRVRIENNIVDNAPLGIMTQNTWQNNIINANDITVHDNTAGFPVGILAEHSNYSVIANNYVRSGNTDQLKSGIEVSTGPMNWIYCNTTNTIGAGLNLAGPMQPSWVFKNEMIDNQTGILINTGPFGDIGLTGSPNVAWDNTWVEVNNTYSQTNPNTYSKDYDASLKKIYHRNTGGNYQPVYNWSDNGLSEAIDPDPTSGNLSSIDICSEGTGTDDIVGPEDEKSLVIEVLTDTTTLVNYNEELKWANKMGIYLALLEDDTLLNSDTLITAFYDSCYTANLGKLIRVNNAFEDADKNFENGKGEDYLDTLDNITASIVPEDALRDVLKIALEQNLNPASLTDSVTCQLNNLLLNLFPDSSFALLTVKDNRFSTGQFEDLESIAQQCPFEYGPAVYMARAMLSQVDSIPYQYHNECEYYGEGSGKWDGENESNNIEQESQRIIKVYPNPAGNTLFVELSLLDREKAYIEFYNIAGALVQQTYLQSGKIELNTTKLSAGLYYYNVYINEQREQSGKQVIYK